MSFKTHIICVVRIRRQQASAVFVSDSFSSCIQRIEQNKQKCLFHFPVLEKRRLFPLFSYPDSFRFLLSTFTPLIANLLSSGSRGGTLPRPYF